MEFALKGGLHGVDLGNGSSGVLVSLVPWGLGICDGMCFGEDVNAGRYARTWLVISD